MRLSVVHYFTIHVENGLVLDISRQTYDTVILWPMVEQHRVFIAHFEQITKGYVYIIFLPWEIARLFTNSILSLIAKGYTAVTFCPIFCLLEKIKKSILHQTNPLTKT